MGSMLIGQGVGYRSPSIFAKLVKFAIFGPVGPRYLLITFKFCMVRYDLDPLFHAEASYDQGSGWIQVTPELENVVNIGGLWRFWAVFRFTWTTVYIDPAEI